MTEPVYFKKEDALRLWGHGFPVFIAKDTGVYLITWNPATPKAPRVDMACGYLEDGFYLDEEASPKEDMEKFSEIWDASRSAVGGDDFCDEIPSMPSPVKDEHTHLQVDITEEFLEAQWTSLAI